MIDLKISDLSYRQCLTRPKLNLGRDLKPSEVQVIDLVCNELDSEVTRISNRFDAQLELYQDFHSK